MKQGLLSISVSVRTAIIPSHGCDSDCQPDSPLNNYSEV